MITSFIKYSKYIELCSMLTFIYRQNLKASISTNSVPKTILWSTHKDALRHLSSFPLVDKFPLSPVSSVQDKGVKRYIANAHVLNLCTFLRLAHVETCPFQVFATQIIRSEEATFPDY